MVVNIKEVTSDEVQKFEAQSAVRKITEVLTADYSDKEKSLDEERFSLIDVPDMGTNIITVMDYLTPDLSDFASTHEALQTFRDWINSAESFDDPIEDPYLEDFSLSLQGLLLYVADINDDPEENFGQNRPTSSFAAEFPLPSETGTVLLVKLDVNKKVSFDIVYGASADNELPVPTIDQITSAKDRLREITT